MFLLMPWGMHDSLKTSWQAENCSRAFSSNIIQTYVMPLHKKLVYLEWTRRYLVFKSISGYILVVLSSFINLLIHISYVINMLTIDAISWVKRNMIFSWHIYWQICNDFAWLNVIQSTKNYWLSLMYKINLLGQLNYEILSWMNRG